MKHKLTIAMVTVINVALWCGPLLAQVPEKPGPPPPKVGMARYYPLIFTLIVLAGVAISAFKSSKRTHQD